MITPCFLPYHQESYELLKNYEPSTEEEKVYQEQMLIFMRTCSDCFLRSCAVGHFTASALLLNQEKTHGCFMHHKKLDRWVQAGGGHCDGHPHFLEVALQETREETGLNNIRPFFEGIFDLDIHLIPERKEEKAHYHFDVRFLLHHEGGEDLKANHESKDLQWISKDNKVFFQGEKSFQRILHKWTKFLSQGE